MSQPFHAEVLATTQISPHFLRVRLGGAGMDRFSTTGFDQWFRLFLPSEGETVPRLPDFNNDTGLREWYRNTPEDQRPVLRNYTVRACDPAAGHIDVDFLLHDDPGPAADWALRARPGDIVGVYDQEPMFTPREDADWRLFVADGTGMPAIAGCLDSMTAPPPCRVFTLLPSAADRQQLRMPAGSQEDWIYEDKETDPTAAIIDAVREAEFPAGRVQAFLVGESGLVTTLRRHLVNDRGIDKDRITFCGYWRKDTAH